MAPRAVLAAAIALACALAPRALAAADVSSHLDVAEFEAGSVRTLHRRLLDEDYEVDHAPVVDEDYEAHPIGEGTEEDYEEEVLPVGAVEEESESESSGAAANGAAAAALGALAAAAAAALHH